MLQNNAHYGASTQFAQARLWRLISNCLVVPAAALAALAGGISLSDPSSGNLAGVLALVASALAGVQAALNPARKELTAQNCANAALEVRNDARQLLTLDLEGMSPQGARDRVRELTMRINEIHRIADPPSGIAWRLGHRRARRSRAFFVKDAERAADTSTSGRQ
ncbi:SLATT domain-containing protein [Micromonospora palythoicola]|uniref:SLATT domain-containing protein n=1 Tax=Micromonospora palythoicola TaxID=3120507 RepID=UPI0038CC0C3D